MGTVMAQATVIHTTNIEVVFDAMIVQGGQALSGPSNLLILPT